MCALLGVSLKHLFILLACLVFTCLSMGAKASTTAENIEKCKLMAKIPDYRLKTIADSIHSTVPAIRNACAVLMHEASNGHSRGHGGGGHSSGGSSGSSDHCGGCGGGDICMWATGGWQCVFHSSPNNVCHTQGDCGNGICENGTCH